MDDSASLLELPPHAEVNAMMSANTHPIKNVVIGRFKADWFDITYCTTDIKSAHA
jgi:hypothetical protein|tara:strand:+ start:397 stop:561 length:165 start_codon:yes stop_codon:yes gene_type:complete